jgi:hypothetical protein
MTIATARGYGSSLLLTHRVIINSTNSLRVPSCKSTENRRNVDTIGSRPETRVSAAGDPPERRGRSFALRIDHSARWKFTSHVRNLSGLACRMNPEQNCWAVLQPLTGGAPPDVRRREAVQKTELAYDELVCDQCQREDVSLPGPKSADFPQ